MSIHPELGQVTYCLHFAAPVTPGSLVELTFYQRRAGVILSRGPAKEGQPLVRDLSTGIEYTSTDNYGLYDFSLPQGSTDFVPTLRSDLRVARVERGRVVRCLVMQHGDFSQVTLMTLLREDD